MQGLGPAKVSALLAEQDDPVHAKAFSKSSVGMKKAVSAFRKPRFCDQAATLARNLVYVYKDEGLALPPGELDFSGIAGPQVVNAEAGDSVNTFERQNVCDDQRSKREGGVELKEAIGKILEGVGVPESEVTAGWPDLPLKTTKRLNN